MTTIKEEVIFMRECEARYVLKMSKAGRNRFYALVKKNRGDAAVKELINNVRAEFEKLPLYKKKQLKDAA